MKKQILFGRRRIDYTLRVSRRAQALRLQISCEAGVVLTRPFFMPAFLADKFLREHVAWIMEKLDLLAGSAGHVKRLGGGQREYLRYREAARRLVVSRLEHFNQIYGFVYRRVSIKNNKSRWGSCSRRGNLNFNYKLIKLPELLADYVIAHELCHLAEFNHAKAFWRLLAEAIPDYRERKKELALWRG